jgi:ATP-dependent DNA ligase
MSLPLPLDYAPMEAESVPELPAGVEWQYEPKWDGFRCLAFRDGERIELRSKSGQPLGRYFPDIVAALTRVAAMRFVLDGELVIAVDGALSFEELQLRLHPAASRVEKLAAAHPAQYELFDLLADEQGHDLTALPLVERRAALERLMPRLDSPALALSPFTCDLAVARHWLEALPGGQDGVVAKRRDLPYRSGLRDGMRKIKRLRTADCVVGGFRYLKNSREVGSLLLGLYDDEGRLDHVGFTSTIPAKMRPALTRELQALEGGPGFTGRAPGGPSRWTGAKSSAWQPLRPQLVVEVLYDHVSGGRFRHGTMLLHFRPDKAPQQCRLDQILPPTDPGRGPIPIA